MSGPAASALLLPKDIADKFRVDVTTVRRWLRTGKLAGIRTPGGQWRCREGDVQELLSAPTNRNGLAGDSTTDEP